MHKPNAVLKAQPQIKAIGSLTSHLVDTKWKVNYSVSKGGVQLRAREGFLALIFLFWWVMAWILDMLGEMCAYTGM